MDMLRALPFPCCALLSRVILAYALCTSSEGSVPSVWWGGATEHQTAQTNNSALQCRLLSSYLSNEFHKTSLAECPGQESKVISLQPLPLPENAFLVD